MAAAITAIEKEAAARARIGAVVRGAKLLAARFAGVPALEPVPMAPAPKDRLRLVLTALDRLPKAKELHLIVPGVTAATPPEERKARTQHAAAQFVAERHADQLPDEVVAIIASAPMPPDPNRKQDDELAERRKQREEREHDAFARYEKEAEAVGALPPGAHL